jgi:hypothetical protein
MKSTVSITSSLALLSLMSVLAVPMSHADDVMTRATPTKKEMMRDCIRKHQSSDVNLSKSALNRICKDEVKQERLTGTPPPPTDAPEP